MVVFYRRLPTFDYIKPKNIDEAVSLLEGNKNGKYRVYAGGTDIIPKIKSRVVNAPEVLIDLKGIANLDYINHDTKDGLRIGALSSVYSVAHSSIVLENYPILAQAANSIAATQIQNLGTIVGNICNAVPSADSAPALLCLKAKLLCISSRGEQTIEIEDFFTGPGKTSLNPDEVLKEIRIPGSLEKGRGVYIKLSPRSRMDLAVVGVAATSKVEKGVFRDVRIGLGAVAPTPLRAKGAEEILIGEKVDEKIIEKAAKKASEECTPISDHRASAEYRRIMVEVLVRRAIHKTISDSRDAR